LIAGFIITAYEYLSGQSGWLGRYAILREQYEYYSPSLPYSGVELPMRPWLQAYPVEISSWDGESGYLPLVPTLYAVTGGELDFAKVRQVSFSTASFLRYNPRAYRIQFYAGHINAAEVPMPIKLSIRMLAAHWFANREAVGPDGRTIGQDIPYGLRNLCGRYKIALDHS
jgi:hypothetical protein